MDNDSTVKQLNNNEEKEVKPKGFQANPENINRNGRPKKGESLADLMRVYLDKPHEKEAITNKEKFVQSVFKKAIDGEVAAMKLVWNYIDGMPLQPTDLTSGGERIGTPTREVADILQKIYEQKDSSDQDDN